MNQKAVTVLILNTLAFTVCFAAWTLTGVLTTFLTGRGLFSWSPTEIGWLLSVPILAGSLTRLPVGMATDRYGGRLVYPLVMILAAGGLFYASYANSYAGFLLAGLGYGLAGASFAVGVASTSLWFRPTRQGTALGIFGIGNIGAALTSFGTPHLLSFLTGGGTALEGWRKLPQLYALSLVVMAILFVIFSPAKKVEEAKRKTFREHLSPLQNLRTWRFGLYYFFLFGGFVALAQWLVPYYAKGYALPLQKAGLLAALFSLPCGVIRAFGGWISDHWGARKVLYAVFTVTFVGSLFLSVPDLSLALFTPLVFLIGISMGIGMGAVYKHIPSYFPKEVGIVGGLVGVIGGLGGFFLPILFGSFLKTTGLWTTCWMVFAVLSFASLVWMHQVVRRMEKEKGLEMEVAHA